MRLQTAVNSIGETVQTLNGDNDFGPPAPICGTDAPSGVNSAAAQGRAVSQLEIHSRPLPQYAEHDPKTLASHQKVKTIAPVPVAITVDGVDMRFDAVVVLEGHFPQGLYLGRKELRCYNIGSQDAYGEACIDERASLVVAFGHQNQIPIPLFGMVDTGSGVSILSYNAYNKIASATQIIWRPFDTPLFAANGQLIHTLGVAENVPFQLGGHTLKTTFVVLAGDSGVDDFLLGRNFLRAYNVLVDLNNRKILIRDPLAHKVHACQYQVMDEKFRVVTHESIVLEPGECRTTLARVLTDDPDSLIYRNVLVSPAYSSAKRPSVLRDDLAAVTADGLLVVPVRNPTDKQLLLRNHTLVGTARLTTFSCSPVSQGATKS